MQAHDAEVYMDVVIPWRTSTGGVTIIMLYCHSEYCYMLLYTDCVTVLTVNFCCIDQLTTQKSTVYILPVVLLVSGKHYYAYLVCVLY